MTHDQLCHDLAHTKETIFINIPLGSAYQASYSGTRLPRADVVRVRPSYTQWCVDIFEVKQSRADFLSDIRTEKWKAYLPYCNRFYFAIESGIASKDDIPEEVGLLIRGKKGWHTAKGAKARDIDIDISMLFALIFFRQRQPYNYNHRQEMSQAWYGNKKRTDLLNRLFGHEVGNELASIKNRLKNL